MGRGFKNLELTHTYVLSLWTCTVSTKGARVDRHVAVSMYSILDDPQLQQVTAIRDMLKPFFSTILRNANYSEKFRNQLRSPTGTERGGT
jgi:hypothetical protein